MILFCACSALAEIPYVKECLVISNNVLQERKRMAQSPAGPSKFKILLHYIIINFHKSVNKDCGSILFYMAFLNT